MLAHVMWPSSHAFHKTLHFLFFFFLSFSRVDGGSSAATIACARVSDCMWRGDLQAYLIEYVLQLVLRQRRALDILDCTQFSRHPLAVLALDRRHSLFGELVLDRVVLAQIDLGADNQARHARAVVMHLGEPLLADVLERGGRRHGEADEEDIGLGIRERAQAIVVFLSSGVEEAEGVGLVTDPCTVSSRSPAVQRHSSRCGRSRQGGAGSAASGEGGSHNGDGVVVEDGGHIFRGELVRGVADQQTCLADGTVADDDAPAQRMVSDWTLDRRRSAVGNWS
jgi:hypothetical protein